MLQECCKHSLSVPSRQLARHRTNSNHLGRRWITLDGRQRLSNLWVGRTTFAKDEPSKDGDGNGLLQKAGFIAPSASGFFHILPLGLRVQDKLTRLIEKHMSRVGASKLALTSVSDQSIWQKSGRLQGALEAGNHEFLALMDRKRSGYLLSPTHEEAVTMLVKSSVQSYRDLPLRLYQITTKYRDELRPRQGLLRTKEFLMKDLYTFDATAEQALDTYNQVKAAYDSLFDEIGIPYLTAEADSGTIGGKLNHEYHYASPVGEDIVWSCDSCSYTANEEVVDRRRTKENEEMSCKCPRCTSGVITPTRTIEVGHTFNLGTKYSAPFGLDFGTEQPEVTAHAQMGCFGIGVSRLLGAIASVLAAPTGQTTPAFGLRWPRGLAPFDVLIVAEADHKHWAVYDTLVSSSDGRGTDTVEALIDDRDQRVGWKLKRADLVGFPVVIVLGQKYKTDGKVEITCRQTAETVFVDEADVKHTVLQMLSHEAK